MAFRSLICILYLVGSSISHACSQCVFTFNFDGKSSGVLHVALFDKETAYPDPTKARKTYTIDVNNQASARLELTDLPTGTYAASAYLDLNGNHQLDQNLFGVPTEAYGYSNGARPKYRAAKWEEVRFTLDRNTAGSRQYIIPVKKWSL